MSKIVFISGSAKGIGRAAALEFAKNGYTVILNTKKSKDELAATLDKVKKYSPSSAAFISDVSDYEQAKNTIKDIYNKFGGIDVLVNNAGISHIGLFEDMKPHEWQHIIKNNVESMLNCTHLVLPDMVRRHCGCIINISSMWGTSGASCEAVYSASKGAMNAFTKALAKELGPSGITVNAIACGAVQTDMNSFLSDEERSDFIEQIPLCRFGTPEEVAGLALFLAEKNTYITGQIIGIDGGF